MQAKYFIFILITILSSNLATYANSPKIKNTHLKFIVEEFCPYVCKDKSFPGIAVEVLRSFSKKENIALTISFNSWANSYQKVKKDLNIMSLSTKTDQNIRHSKEALSYITETIFSLKHNKWKYEGTNSFKQGKLALTQGRRYSKSIELYKASSAENILYTSNEKPFRTILPLMIMKKVDYTIEDYTIGMYQIKNKNLEDKIKFSKQLSHKRLVFITSKKNNLSIINKLDHYLLEIKNSGHLKNLFAKYKSFCYDCL